MPGQRPPRDSCRRTAPARRIRALERLHAAQQPVRKPVHSYREGHLPRFSRKRLLLTTHRPMQGQSRSERHHPVKRSATNGSDSIATGDCQVDDRFRRIAPH
jgi:hypothetical protein